MSDGDCLEVEDLDAVMPPAVQQAVAGSLDIAEAIVQAKRDAIGNALRAAGGNKAQAARLLDISRAALYEKLAALGVDAASP